MAWRNLGRNRRRTAINLSAIAFATITMIFMSAFQSGSYGQMIDSAVKMQTGHLQIQHEKFLEEKNIHYAVGNVDQVLKVADAEPHVLGAAGRISSGFLVAKDESSFVALVTGVDPERELKTSNWASWVKQGAFLSSDDPRGAIVGHQLASNLDAVIGDELVLVGQAFDGSVAAAKVTIRGFIKTGQPDLDRMAVMVDLPLMQEMMTMPNMVNAVAILLEGYEQTAAIQASLQQKMTALNGDLRALPWDKVEPAIQQSIQLDNAFGKIMVFMLLLVVAFGILNTFMMSAVERYREFGMLMAIGVRPLTCSALLMLESQMLVVVGFLIGLALGGGTTLYFEGVGISLGEDAAEMMAQYGMSGNIFPDLTWGIVAFVFAQVWLVTLLVALYPSFKITRFRPVEALRQN
jgi:putative ABC transport system permease protein